jgi:hypothetical protein
VARVGSSVILSGPMPAGEAVNCVAVGEDPPTTPDLLIIVCVGEAVGCARDVGDLGCTRWHSGAGLRTRVGSMVDT